MNFDFIVFFLSIKTLQYNSSFISPAFIIALKFEKLFLLKIEKCLIRLRFVLVDFHIKQKKITPFGKVFLLHGSYGGCTYCNILTQGLF